MVFLKQALIVSHLSLFWFLTPTETGQMTSGKDPQKPSITTESKFSNLHQTFLG